MEIHSLILWDKVLDHILDEFGLQLRLILIVLLFQGDNCRLIRFLCLLCRLVYIALFYRVDFLLQLQVVLLRSKEPRFNQGLVFILSELLDGA